MSRADAWDSAERMLVALVGPGQSSTAHRVAHDYLVEYGRHVLMRIAELAEAMGQQAGVGGMETAGHLVSYLAEQPVHLESLLSGGIFELPSDWIERGCLTHQARNGQVVHPERVRQSRIIKRMERPA